MCELDQAAIVELARIAEERDLTILKVRSGETEVVITRGRLGNQETPQAIITAGAEEARGPQPATRTSAVEPAPAAQETRAGGEPSQPAAVAASSVDVPGRVTVRAPMVGTFYRASTPGAPPFVEVGAVVQPGATVGLVEAMKVYTAVTAEEAGTVVEVLAENGVFVEFGDPLVILEAAPARVDEAR